MDDASFETYLNHKGKGFVKIWAVDERKGSKFLLIDKQNLIINNGADLLAQALAGVPNSSISHIYVGYNNVVGAFTPPGVDKEYTNKFTDYGGTAWPGYGYLRLPLSYTPSFIAQEGYNNNVAVFTTTISGSGSYHGVAFHDSLTAPASQIFEVALVAAEDPENDSKDVVFSRANFTPLLYDSNFNLTITWGVQFLA